jgi:hypothetical protein
MPALGASLILIALGAILAFAVTATVEGIAIATVGVILMAVGFLGLLIALLFLMTFSPFASRHYVDTPDHRHHDRHY